MKTFFKVTKGKIILFIVLFLLTLALPLPVNLSLTSFSGGGAQAAPLFLIYMFLIVLGSFGLSHVSSGVELSVPLKLIGMGVGFLILHIIIVYFITCLISAVYSKFRGNKIQQQS